MTYYQQQNPMKKAENNDLLLLKSICGFGVFFLLHCQRKCNHPWAESTFAKLPQDSRYKEIYITAVKTLDAFDNQSQPEFLYQDGYTYRLEFDNPESPTKLSIYLMNPFGYQKMRRIGNIVFCNNDFVFFLSKPPLTQIIHDYEPLSSLMTRYLTAISQISESVNIHSRPVSSKSIQKTVPGRQQNPSIKPKRIPQKKHPSEMTRTLDSDGSRTSVLNPSCLKPNRFLTAKQKVSTYQLRQRQATHNPPQQSISHTFYEIFLDNEGIQLNLLCLCLFFSRCMIFPKESRSRQKNSLLSPWKANENSVRTFPKELFCQIPINGKTFCLEWARTKSGALGYNNNNKSDYYGYDFLNYKFYLRDNSKKNGDLFKIMKLFVPYSKYHHTDINELKIDSYFTDCELFYYDEQPEKPFLQFFDHKVSIDVMTEDDIVNRISSLVSDKTIVKKLKYEMEQIRSFPKSGSFKFTEIDNPLLVNEGCLTSLTSLMKNFIETFRIILSVSHLNEPNINEIIDIERELLESYYDCVTEQYLNVNRSINGRDPHKN